MSHYFASDVHLRIDKPERGQQFAAFVDRLTAADTLIIAGDLCDFWFATRQLRQAGRGCLGLQSLRGLRERGGRLLILAGNHDAWLRGFYEQELDAEWIDEPLDLQLGQLRVRVIHGHATGRRWDWKRLLETKIFHDAFRSLPALVANPLERALLSEKSFSLKEKNARWLAAFRGYLADNAAAADLFVFGHLHQQVDERHGAVRLVVLGDWCRPGARYLVVDADGARTVPIDC